MIRLSSTLIKILIVTFGIFVIVILLEGINFGIFYRRTSLIAVFIGPLLLAIAVFSVSLKDIANTFMIYFGGKRLDLSNEEVIKDLKNSASILRKMALYTIFFGVVHAIVGVIFVFIAIGTAEKGAIGHGLAVATLSLLYALLLAGLIYLPLADNIDFMLSQSEHNKIKS